MAKRFKNDKNMKVYRFSLVNKSVIILHYDIWQKGLNTGEASLDEN